MSGCGEHCAGGMKTKFWSWANNYKGTNGNFMTKKEVSKKLLKPKCFNEHFCKENRNDIGDWLSLW